MESQTMTATQTWVTDPTHSEVLFKIKHLMITNVTGQFSKFEAIVTAEDDKFTNADIQFSADVNAVTTNNEQRDVHLKSGDFFEVEKYPQMKFHGKTPGGLTAGNDFTLTGDLTIRDVTKEIKLQVEFGGVAKDPYGNTKAGFTISGKINRKDFGLTWNAVTEAGGIVVSEDVKIACEIQLVLQA